MIKKLLLVILPSLFLNCNKDPNVDASKIMGSWLLVATLVDPCDGSGRFLSAKEKQTVRFATDNSLKDYGKVFCGNEDLEFSIDKTAEKITIIGCAIDPEIYNCKFTTSVLILNNSRCIEACALKFRKISD